MLDVVAYRHSRSSGKKHSRYEHKHKRRKSPLPSDVSRTRRREGRATDTFTDNPSDKSSAKSSKHVSSSQGQEKAEKRTRIVLQIFEEVLQNGVVVDSKMKESVFTAAGGFVPWPLSCQDKESAQRQLQSEVGQEGGKSRGGGVAGKNPVTAAVDRAKQSKSTKPDTGGGGGGGVKRSSSQKAQQEPGKRLKGEGKSEGIDDDEDRRIEMASTLLSLQTESPVKKVERQDNFHEVIFQPLKEGNSVMAKWTDKNFYAGSLSVNLGDGRWHVVFDDGGKKAVNESDIISVPHLSIGQSVMATFSDGSLCLKGMVKQPLYDKTRLFYFVEYNDGSRNVTEKFSRRDIFLTADLAAALLNRQSKGSDKLSKFADVDLNNIIPKRSRQSAQSKAVDGSTDDSETESTSSGKTAARARKPVHGKAVCVSATPARTQPKSPIERKSSGRSENGEPAPSPVSVPTEPVVVAAAILPNHESSSQDLLGPIPAEGSVLFGGMTFLLTTADAGNSSDNADSGRSSTLFDIPHLIRQIEAGGGRVHQTLENAQVTVCLACPS